MKKVDTLRALALLALIAAAVAGLIVLSVNAPLREAMGESLGRFRGWAWGPVVFAAVYAVACLVLPGSLITLAAGTLFGVVVGTAVVSLASVTGASLAFWLGRYNLVVLGAGTAGLISAVGAAGLGARVALVEREFLGGDCLNVGCVPSKALIRASRAAADVRDAHDYGLDVPAGVRVNFPAAMERMRRLRAALSPTDSAARYRGLGVDVFFGRMHLTILQANDDDVRVVRDNLAGMDRPALTQSTDTH
jgi:hypothetical protein